MGKPTLVLDVDETLVATGIFGGRYGVQKRPWVDRFIKSMCSEYSVVLFTSAVASYARAMSWELDPLQVRFAKVLSREHMSWQRVDGFQEEQGVKDLTRLGYSLEDVLWIDDIKENFRDCPDNGLEVPKFDGDEADVVLKALEPLLLAVATVRKRSGIGIQASLESFRRKWGRNVTDFASFWAGDARDDDTKFRELLLLLEGAGKQAAVNRESIDVNGALTAYS